MVPHDVCRLISSTRRVIRKRTAEFTDEHLEGLPDGLLVEDVGARIWVGAVLDALHVLGAGGRSEAR